LHPWAGISAEENRIRLKIHEDYFSHPRISKSHFRLNDAPEGMVITAVEYLNPSECILQTSQTVAGFPDISLTVEKKILNTWQDITSHKLASAGTGGLLSDPEISVFGRNGTIHIRCDRPERLPDQVEVLNMTGQVLAVFNLEKVRENIVNPRLASGIYIIRINTEPNPQIHRQVITR
jgi:hypothetical protein